MKKFILMVFVLISIVATGCTDAQIASHNISKDAEMFRIIRRVVFFNGITDNYLLVIEGKCSIEQRNKKLEVTCKAPDGYKKHYLGLSDNVSYFVEQVKTVGADVKHYKVIFKPSAIVPNIELR